MSNTFSNLVKNINIRIQGTPEILISINKNITLQHITGKLLKTGREKEEEREIETYHHKKTLHSTE